MLRAEEGSGITTQRKGLRRSRVRGSAAQEALKLRLRSWENGAQGEIWQFLRITVSSLTLPGL